MGIQVKRRRIAARTFRRGGVVLALAALAGCGDANRADSGLGPEPAYEAVADRAAFADALQAEYLIYATRAFDRDARDASDFYAERSLLAADRKLPTLSGESRALTGAAGADARRMRSDIEGLFTSQARQRAPGQAAVAQVAYDCWMREATAGATTEAETCRVRADAAISALRAELPSDAELTLASAAPAEEPTETLAAHAVLPEGPVYEPGDQVTRRLEGADGPRYAYVGRIGPNGELIERPRSDAHGIKERAAPVGKATYAKDAPVGKATYVAATRPEKAPSAGRASAIAASADPIQGEFTVFFDVNSDALTEGAEELLSETAIAAARERGATKAIVAGHTDSVGSARYNQMLSMRRAQSVRQFLQQALGAAFTVEIRAFGESDLREATEDDVDAQANRRVEIVLE